MSNNHRKEAEAIGWKAIDNALYKIYKGEEPKHMAPILPFMLGGEEPLNGISAYKRMDPVPHWHYITYGFSELYEKESDDPERSGFGFELTFRVRSDEDEPPAWAFNFLNNLAKYIFKSGNYFANGHYLNANGPIALEIDTELKAAAFVYDPELPAINTLNGKVEFLQVVGITLDEELAIKSWKSTRVLDLFSKYLPLYITDLKRKSLMDNSDIEKAVGEGIKADGSNTGTLFTNQLNWTVEKKFLSAASYKVVIGALVVRDMLKVLPGRIPKGNELTVLGYEKALVFKPGRTADVHLKKEKLIITVNDELYNELMGNLLNKSKEIVFKSVKGLIIQVEKTEIRNRMGEVEQVIDL